MSLRDFPQQITYWAASPDTYGGNTFAAPLLINGRWQDRKELFYNDRGDEIQSKAIVYLDSDVLIGDYIALGDHTATPIATNVSEAFCVMQFRKTPDIRIQAYERKAYL